MSECSICIEPFTKRTRKEIVCFNCQKSTCSQCVRKFILQSLTEAKCLHCNIQWDRRFMVNNLTKSFCDKDYRQHRLEVLYQRNKCYIPRVCEMKEIRKTISSLENEKKKLFKKMEDYSREIYKQIHSLDDEKNKHFSKLKRLENQFVRNQIITEEEQKNKDHQFNRPCITVECLGFLNNKGNCPICKKKTCLQCNIDITDNENHSCKKEDIDQWECVKKTTKPCPSCRVRIFKITGCDQMWCTNCNTPFSWKKGTIETGPVHNPHYFDWLFDGGTEMRGNNVDICNQNNLPSVIRIEQTLCQKKNISNFELRKDDDYRQIISNYRILIHIENVELPIINITQERYRNGLLHNLYSLFDNLKFGKKQIEQYDYKKECDREIYQIITTYLQQQRYHYHSFILDESLSSSSLLKELNDTKRFYHNAIERFEKEYNRSYRSLKRYIID